MSFYQKYQDTINLLIFIFLVAILFFLIYQRNDNIAPISSFDIDSINKKNTEILEPKIVNWRKYDNKEYSFIIDVPEEWYEQEYKFHYPKGGTLIAFSPDHLPCETCSYFKDGFFSIKIYNPATDPQFYAMYLAHKKNINKNPRYQLIIIDQHQGFIFENIVFVENQGWIYELSLDKNEGISKITDSEIFQHVIASFKFTNLKFNQ